MPSTVSAGFQSYASRQYRALLFVNGWQVGDYVNYKGPQHSFPVPNGILNPDGTNSIAIAVWNLDGSTGGLGQVSLTNYGSYASSLRVAQNDSPRYDSRKYAMPKPPVGKTDVAIAPSNSKRIYALIQTAEFTGVVGISFAIAFTNVIAVTTPLRLFAEAKTHRMRPHFDLTLTMVGIVGLLAFGLHRVQNQSAGKSLRVAAIQTNIPQEQKFNPTEQILDTCDQLSASAVQRETGLGLIVWPEASIPGRLGYDDDALLQFPIAVAQRSGADLLFGIDDEEDNRAYNAALLISPTGESQLYRKIHLVPFGEYIPLRNSFPLFAAVASTWVPGDFNAGSHYTVFNLTNADVRVAPLICFEDTVGDLVRHFVINGANLLVNVTNDGWFRHSSGSQQHLANAIFRCVENRRPMVRAANTGVTCFVNEFGRVTKFLHDEKGSTFVQDVLIGEVNVPQDRQLTFYALHGEWFAECCAVVTAITVIFVFVRRKVTR